MALITGFHRADKQNPKVHKPVECGYCSFIGDDQRRYLLLETYGSQDRDFPNKISQSVQLDEQAAKALIALIKQEFPNLA